jgi:hypothetical protein
MERTLVCYWISLWVLGCVRMQRYMADETLAQSIIWAGLSGSWSLIELYGWDGYIFVGVVISKTVGSYVDPTLLYFLYTYVHYIIVTTVCQLLPGNSAQTLLFQSN